MGSEGSRMSATGPVYVKRRGRTFAQWPTGYVYFALMIQRPGAIKVGWSQNPWSRACGLSSEYGSKIEIVDYVEIERGSPQWGVAYGSLEYSLHRQLARRRCDPIIHEFAERGEWYAMTAEEAHALAGRLRTSIADGVTA